jgi:hypothetical protein
VGESRRERAMDDADRRAAELLAAYYDDVVAESRPRLRGLIAGAIRDGRAELLDLLVRVNREAGNESPGFKRHALTPGLRDAIRDAIRNAATDFPAAGPGRAE